MAMFSPVILRTHRVRSACAPARDKFTTSGVRSVANSMRGGDSVTLGHIDCRKSDMVGVGDQREALVVRGLYSGLAQVYPVASKSADDTVIALTRFRGVHEVKLVATEHPSSRVHVAHWGSATKFRSLTILETTAL